MKKNVIIIFGTLLTAYILVCLSLRIWQNRLIFAPKSELIRTPKDLDLDYEEVWISIPNKSPEEEVIHGWWIPRRSNFVGSSRVLLSLHGKGGNISTSSLNRAEGLRRLGFSILLIDYRGYGASKGNFPTEQQAYEDAELAWKYLIETRKIPPKDIYIYGFSLGGAIAIDLAIDCPEAAGLIVESSLTSMRAIADNNAIYRLFPLDFILTEKFDSLSKIGSLKIPLLLIHGMKDEVIPAVMGRALFDRAPAPKKIKLFPDSGHGIATKDTKEYLQTIKDFYRSIEQKQP